MLVLQLLTMLEKAILSYIRRKFSDVNHITTNDLDSQLKQTYEPTKDVTQPDEKTDSKIYHVVLDCRRKDEYEVSHLPNSKNLHFQTDEESLIDFLKGEISKQCTSDSCNEELNVVCYCSLGYRSSILAQKVENLTRNDPNLRLKNIKVWNLEGSIFKWANESRPLKDLNEKPTTSVHPFSYTFCMFLERKLWKWSPDHKDES